MSDERQEEEEWRPVVGYEGRYEVSSWGRIRSFAERNRKARILKPAVSDGGYEIVGLWADGQRKSQRLHIAIATAWHGPCPEGQVCRHLDGNKLNNVPSNLAWGTTRENTLDMVSHGTHNFARRTECSKGHRYTPESTRLKPENGRHTRVCRICHNERQAKNRAAAAGRAA